jgi:precorrin-6Y C5,15-methyltransferase (decarboxylating)
LLPLLAEAGIDAEVLPGISSIQVMAARLKRPWQDWKLVSAHGTDCDPVTEVMEGRDVFFLTGGALGPAELCGKLTKAGLGDLKIWIGERLSYNDEIILAGTAAEYAGCKFDSLSVMLVEAAPCKGDMTPGIDDEEVIRGDIPMTKQTVRAAIISKMKVTKTDTVWDVGAGTGSVSVELAMKASSGAVWAVEKAEEGCRLIEENKKKFGVWNLNIVPGKAPEAMEELPAPDKVFIGGSSGNLEEIMDLVLAKNEGALVCVSAIVLETMADTVKLMTERGMDTDIIHVSVNTSRPIGKRHMMMATNPIYIITGRKKTEAAE